MDTGYQISEIPYRPVEEQLPTEGEFVLLKTGRVTPWDRWSILGWDPWFVWRAAPGADPFAALQQLQQQFAPCVPSHPSAPCPIPLLMGAFAYDAGRAVETIPATARAAMHHLPDAVLYGFRYCIIVDELEQRGYRVRITEEALKKIGWKMEDVPSSVPRLTSSGFSSNFARADYIAAVERIRAMIADGDCYQVNLSQQIHAPCASSAVELFRTALAANPAPMMALVEAGDFQLISTSPERLVQRRGAKLMSRPIKGTRPRGATPSEDRCQREALLTDPKEAAELAMIVDLVRNDLGRVAQPGTVRVMEPKVVESYANVHHLLATIVAQARPTSTWVDLFRAIFPGGSVTGCPKVQAMQVIETIEGVRRGFYCGSIGYIAANGDGDWNIVIRTITKIGDQALFNVGGAVTYDSNPRREYFETLQKGATMAAALGIRMVAESSAVHTGRSPACICASRGARRK